jgi:hypothetical protein
MPTIVCLITYARRACFRTVQESKANRTGTANSRDKSSLSSALYFNSKHPLVCVYRSAPFTFRGWFLCISRWISIKHVHKICMTVRVQNGSKFKNSRDNMLIIYLSLKGWVPSCMFRIEILYGRLSLICGYSYTMNGEPFKHYILTGFHVKERWD